MKEIDIEELICPKHGNLIIDKENYIVSGKILDAELDILNLEFQEGIVEIDTKDLSYIMLTRENLYTMLRLITKAEAEYDKIPLD